MLIHAPAHASRAADNGDGGGGGGSRGDGGRDELCQLHAATTISATTSATSTATIATTALEIRVEMNRRIETEDRTRGVREWRDSSGCSSDRG